MFLTRLLFLIAVTSPLLAVPIILVARLFRTRLGYLETVAALALGSMFLMIAIVLAIAWWAMVSSIWELMLPMAS